MGAREGNIKNPEGVNGLPFMSFWNLLLRDCITESAYGEVNTVILDVNPYPCQDVCWFLSQVRNCFPCEPSLSSLSAAPLFLAQEWPAMRSDKRAVPRGFCRLWGGYWPVDLQLS